MVGVGLEFSVSWSFFLVIRKLLMGIHGLNV